MDPEVLARDTEPCALLARGPNAAGRGRTSGLWARIGAVEAPGSQNDDFTVGDNQVPVARHPEQEANPE